MPAPKTDLESLAESFVSEDSEDAQNSKSSLIDKHNTADEIEEEETKKVIENIISCEDKCQTAKQARFSKKTLQSQTSADKDNESSDGSVRPCPAGKADNGQLFL